MKPRDEKKNAPNVRAEERTPPRPVPTQEPPEPRDECGFIPVWLITIMAILLFLGDMYFINHGVDIGGKGGDFPKLVYYPYPNYAAVRAASGAGENDPIEVGRTVYSRNCSLCHQPNGMGTPGMFPPLAGSDWVKAEGHQRIIRIVLNGASGPITVSGAQFNNTMVPWRDTLKDEEIAAVLSYIRNEWGNQGSLVTPDEVKKVREETKDKSGAWNPDELKSLPE